MAGKTFHSYVMEVYGASVGRCAGISCYVNGGGQAGRIDFYPDNSQLPSDFLHHPNPQGETITLHMHMSRFQAVAFLLSNHDTLFNRGQGSRTEGRGYIIAGTRQPMIDESAEQ